MSGHKQYNVAYRDSYGNLCLLFTTPTHHAQALKRLAKHPVGLEYQTGEDGILTGNIKHPTFLVEREISPWVESHG
jgi:hypothetical protein